STPPPLSRRKAVSNGPRSLTFAALFPLTPGETHEEGFVPARRTFFGLRLFGLGAPVGQGRRQAGPHPCPSRRQAGRRARRPGCRETGARGRHHGDLVGPRR